MPKINYRRARVARGRGSYHRRQYRRRQQPQTDSSMLGTPSRVPDVQNNVKGQRWVRFTASKPATGNWDILFSTIAAFAFGTGNASASHIFPHSIRIWLFTSAAGADLQIEVPSHALIESTDESWAAMKYKSVATNGQIQPCVNVKFGEAIRITAYTNTNAYVAARITAAQISPAIAATSVLVDCYVTTVQNIVGKSFTFNGCTSDVLMPHPPPPGDDDYQMI